ncbi:MAG: FAD-binding oxidoreductase [Cellvibrionales bacterium]|nr:FAD-binding oxidoreductase [Cellvibrionales bacterium]
MARFSWGGYPASTQRVKKLASTQSPLPKEPFLPYGLGRSYGDSCLNSQGLLLSSSHCDHFLAFDKDTGVLTCEAGVSLKMIIHHCLPLGWFLPVTPGTQFVTIAGAVANDVHGKNHQVAGSFGCFVKQLELVRSTGERLICSSEQNSDYFYATIGGLGLTGFITQVTLQMKRVNSHKLLVTSEKYQHLDDFFTLSDNADPGHEYQVAWLDCTATGKKLGRGHFISAKHQDDGDLTLPERRSKSVPMTSPISLINNLSVRSFNSLYYQRQIGQRKILEQSYAPFFYPLDGIENWNRLYGKHGFLQHQCVIPKATGRDAIKSMLELIAKEKTGSFLVVLKMMGEKSSGGWLSFPMDGVTLAMDFPYRGKQTLDFLHKLDDIVNEAGGRIYPAKDANMLPATFQHAYPSWEAIEAIRDPNIASDFWRRVTS